MIRISRMRQSLTYGRCLSAQRAYGNGSLPVLVPVWHRQLRCQVRGRMAVCQYTYRARHRFTSSSEELLLSSTPLQ